MITGTLLLAAALNGAPAFTPVNWSIEATQGTGATTHVLGKHSHDEKVAPGRYRVCATLPGSAAAPRCRTADVAPAKSTVVLISLD